MRWIGSLWTRITGQWGSRPSEADLREEFEYHLEMQIQENLRAGMSPKEARRQARIAFGSQDWHAERVREAGGGLFLDDLCRDLVFGLRTLTRRPAFALTGILTLSLGIGMTTTMFTMVDSVLLRPLPGSNARDLVYLELESPERDVTTSPTPELLRVVRDHASSFSTVEAYTSERFNLVVDGEPLRVRGARASAGFFSFLGIRPALGRLFVPGDAVGGNAPVAVLSHPFWMEHFGGDRRALGQTIRIGDLLCEIVGVLPRDFRVDARLEMALWIPMGSAGAVPEEGIRLEGALAKLAPDATLEGARAEMETIIRNNPLAQLAGMEWTARVRNPEEFIDPDFRQAILILQVAALFVLLIGCGNLTNLLLAQGETRSRELAVRASLGARRGRLVKQLLAENLILGLLGGAGGFLLTHWALQALPFFLPPGYSGFSPDRNALFLAAGLSLFSVFAVGILPAWRGSRRQLAGVIKVAPEATGRRRGVGVRQLLVAGQVGLAVVMLISAALLAKSFASLRGMDTGFEPEGLMTFRVDLPEETYPDEKAQRLFYEQLLDRLSERVPPELAETTVATGLVENLAAGFFAISAEGGAAEDQGDPILSFTRSVAPGYFATLEISMTQGREFLKGEDRSDESLIIISQEVARQHFSDGNAVGRNLRLDEDTYRVVGVIQGVALPSLAQSRFGENQLYFPLYQTPHAGITVIARALGNREAVVDLVRQTIRELDPTLPIQKIALVKDLLAESLSEERSNSLLMGLFALTALLLGVLGIYGVVAYSVSQQIREIGVRLALGASKGEVVSRVVRGGMMTVLAGLVLGGLGAAGLGSVLSSLLYQVQPRDPWVFFGVLFLIFGVSLLATWLPARRAAGEAPLESLRSD